MTAQQIAGLLWQGTLQSLFMTLVSAAFAYLIGLPLGVLLVVTDRGGIRPMVPLNRVLGVIVNVIRSLPFVILIVVLLPFTKLIVGTTLGSTAIIVPLVVASAPFIARMVESSLKEVDRGVIEAAQAMGASPLQIIFKVLLQESLPSLINGAAIAVTTILGYSALAGIVGGGGLGSIAIVYGYNRYQTDIGLMTALILIVIVQIFQEAGIRLTRRSDKKNTRSID